VTQVTDVVVPVPLVTGVYALAARPAGRGAGRGPRGARSSGRWSDGHDVRAVEVAQIVDLDHRRDVDIAKAWQESCDEGRSPTG
jgi:hypothetical protein